MVENYYQLPEMNKTNLVDVIETLKLNLHENETKIEHILQDTTCYENRLLENQINKCFDLICQLEDYQKKLKELESGSSCSELPTVLMDFISNISIVENNNCGPEALIVVVSDETKRLYEKIMRRLSINNVIVTTVGALTSSDVRVALGDVKTALLDGSEAAYAECAGGQSVRLVVSDRVPPDRLFYVRGDEHRDECWKHIFQREFAQ